jgi:hypothetical protein
VLAVGSWQVVCHLAGAPQGCISVCAPDRREREEGAIVLGVPIAKLIIVRGTLAILAIATIVSCV